MKILISLLISCWLSISWGACTYTMTTGNFTASVGDLTQSLPHSATISRASNSSSCRNYRLYFGKGQANSYQRQAYNSGQAMTYNLYRTVSLGNVLKDKGDASANESVSGTLTNRNTNYTATWYVEVKSKDSLFNVPPGTYTDTIPVNAYSNNGSDYEITRNMTLSFIVPRYAEVSIVSENSPHNPSATAYIMDFGTLVPQAELRADLIVKANVPYGMHISSTNAGVLKNTTLPSQQAPYQVQVGSSAWITPTTGQTLIGQENSGSTQAGRRYPVKVRLGQFSDLAEGDYQETVTLTVTAY